MKKTFKRIIALAIVLCTVGAMMIPGVSAAETPASLTVNFATAFSNASVSSGTYLQNAGGTPLNDAYETNKWTIYCGDGTTSIHGNDLYAGGRNRAGYLELRNNNISSYGATVKRASKFIAPGTGDYVLSVSYGTASAADNKVVELGAYILPMPETAYDKYTIPGPTSESILTKATKTEPYSNGSVAGSGSGAGTFSAENTVALVEGQQYMIIFYGVAADTTNAYAQFTGFSLTPVVKYDYTVTYHANYEGADPATAVDTENVTGTTAVEAVITLDAPFTREGYNFAGWATAADGDVVYKANETITLNPEAATADLYAIWVEQEEVWDPAFNKDWTVDFKTAFDNAGVAADGYLQSGNMTLLADAYATNGWKLYVDSTGTASKSNSAYPARAAGTRKLFQMRSNSATEIGRVPLLFKAPGTGEYKLSLTFAVNSTAAVRAPLAGAFIMEAPETPYTRYNIPFHTNENAQAVISFNPNEATAGDVLTSETAANLEGGKEYILIFFIQQGSATSYADYSSFSLTEVKPVASIGSANFETLDAAVAAAVSGDTIKLGMDVTATDVNLPANVALDLNGKDLTVEAIAGIVADTADGTGRIITAVDGAAIEAVDGQIAMWDNTTGAEGYRVFGYTFQSLDPEGGEDNVTAVNSEIDFYDYERNFLATSFDENGEVAKGAGDYKFVDVAAQIKADYDAGNTDWRLEYSNQQYQMGRGGVCFSWGNKSIRQFGAGYMAVRFMAPADGKVSVTLKTASSDSAATDASFDLYLLKASDVEALYAGDYEALVDQFVAAPATAVDDLHTTITAAYGAATPVLSGMSDGNAYSGDFVFEDGEEYIAVFLNTGNGGLHMNFQNIRFNRVAKQGEVHTFWSYMKFTNADAYKLVATSGLKVGFMMSTNDNAPVDFEVPDAVVAAWADEEVNNSDKNYGFYIRVSGFESLKENTEVKAVPYLIIPGRVAKTINAAEKTYNFVVE